MITGNHSFVFLGEGDVFINTPPFTYADAFYKIITGLYILYHDYGMFFIKSYANEASVLQNIDAYFEHIKFVCNSRALLQHSDDYITKVHVYRNLINYYFKNDTTFNYKDWHDFWSNATEKHWKQLVLKIVDDSDRFYENCLDKVASHNINSRTLYESISDIFQKGEYITKNREKVKIYERSFDARFLKIIYNKLYYSVTWNDERRAKKELLNFYKQKNSSNDENNLYKKGKLTPQEIKNKAISEMISFLNSGECSDSDCLFMSLCQNVEESIKNQINADIIYESEKLLDL